MSTTVHGSIVLDNVQIAAVSGGISFIEDIAEDEYSVVVNSAPFSAFETTLMLSGTRSDISRFIDEFRTRFNV
jgi:hypothetical protein